MSEHEQAPASRITLDDFIETVTRSVMRAVESQSEVSGYAQALPTLQTQTGLGSQIPTGPSGPMGPILAGLIYVPQGFGGLR
jgi:hypothetical protein